MKILQKLIARHKKKVNAREALCSGYIADIEAALDATKDLFADSDEFIEPDIAKRQRANVEGLLAKIQTKDIQKIRRATDFKKLELKRENLKQVIKNLQNDVDQHNSLVARNRIHKARDLIGNVEGRSLDDQQMSCVVHESHNQLIIAGAGTGKTTTIIGRIKYLLKTERCNPDEILVLSFTNASATEMHDRIRQETQCKIDASTFHKLGLEIIAKANDVKPKITKIELHAFVRDEITTQMKDDIYLRKLSDYLIYSRVPAKSEFEFKTYEEYVEYLKLNPPTTLNGEVVKSYGEMKIANFLLQNGIKYVYEAEYKFDTRDPEYSQYYPDFYLPEYDLYIEYFAVNKKGAVPNYFRANHGMSATEAYQASMRWKRELHRKNHTTMIESFAHEKFDDALLENLKLRLEEHNVPLNPKTSQELWQQILATDKNTVNGMIDLFVTVINLAKSNNYTIAQVRKLNKTDARSSKINSLLLDLVEPILDAYNNSLEERNEIDFNDMINLATKYVQRRMYLHPYKYVIVDEYQDISMGRFKLLKAMRESKDYQLFCVGDDWQSIYRFAGSDVGFILNFEKYWGAAAINKIETTYRFSQSLIQVSSNFVMKNPAQVSKNIIGKADESNFALEEINGYTDNYAIEFMVQKLFDLPIESTVFFIGRYSFDVNLLDNNPSLKCSYDNIEKMTKVECINRSDLKMYFVTAHKAKGLQADYVFIINNKNARMGFPSKIQDAPILDLLLEKCDTYPYAEERRLYYVALTRAKKKAFIVTVKDRESIFALELRECYRREMAHERFTCPKCGGRLVRRQGPYGEFFGCSNYAKTQCGYVRKIGKSQK